MSAWNEEKLQLKSFANVMISKYIAKSVVVFFQVIKWFEKFVSMFSIFYCSFINKPTLISEHSSGITCRNTPKGFISHQLFTHPVDAKKGKNENGRTFP
jgi:hypothetical protein